MRIPVPMHLALALVVAILGWWGGVALRSAQAGYSPASTFGGYSYEDSSCSTASDPITVVFTFGNGWPDHPYDHASLSDHGDWDDKGGGQYIWEDSSPYCSDTDDSAADGDHDRSHMRWEVAGTTAAGQAYAATPHQETWHWDFYPFTGHHCVHPDGFVDARAEVQSLWSSASDGHSYTTSNYWGNTALIEKCDDEMAGSDGYLTYIDLR